MFCHVQNSTKNSRNKGDTKHMVVETSTNYKAYRERTTDKLNVITSDLATGPNNQKLIEDKEKEKAICWS